ncbi:hypothetical protein BS333_07395 [Vibrio azureus]|uniref:PapC N-terminal domain-containing protein n=1 Tax=Vibrio azureus NBRC 104587 TaxID=1219077 RepID=U3C9U1_9VIBR|nr:fimbria/pilus outer membrane usher protein [Vibrio azureus]AUI86228.1 hypothetical protein BS333_07395 [Vibrio azureus]GAD78124.1 hypothetical protein VAZ01S_128_00070 [Vibrio azureus NBRC 104587]
MFRLKITIAMLFIFCIKAHAQTELDLSFLQGKQTKIPNIFKNITNNIPGEYFLDTFINGENVGRKTLTIMKEDSSNLCLPDDFVEKLYRKIDLDKLKTALNAERQCYDFTQITGGGATFDYAQQALRITLPQVVFLSSVKGNKWDYGVSGFNLSYQVNASKNFGLKSSEDSTQYFSDFDLNINYDKWVLSASAYALNDEKVRSPDIKLTRALEDLQSDLTVGKDYFNGSLIEGFSFYGVSLNSNSRMRPHRFSGYAPQINGVLNSVSLVTVKQNQRVLFAQTLPAGPYSLNDIAPAANGDITVIIEDANGVITRRSYPVASLPELLRPDNYNYNLSVGTREHYELDDQKFALASVDYGLEFGTVGFASLFHPKYHSVGSSLAFPLGDFGAMSTSINLSWSRYDFAAFQPNGNATQSGFSTKIKYAKDLGKTTNLQLLSYHYSSAGYVDFADFKPARIHSESPKRSRYEVKIAQRLGSAHLALSAWRQDYRDKRKNQTGTNLSLSKTTEQGVMFGLNASYENSTLGEKEYSTTFSLSIPINFISEHEYLNSSVSYADDGSTLFNNGMSISTEDQTSYSLDSTWSKERSTLTISSSHSFDAARAGLLISKNNQSTTVASSLSGSIAAVKDIGYAFSNVQSKTIALVRVQDIEGITLRGSSPTNESGNTIVPLVSYRDNDIRLEGGNIPSNVEFSKTAYKVTPSGNAIIVKNYDYQKVNRYLLRVYNNKDQVFSFGTEVISEKNSPVGIIAKGGILYATLYSNSKNIFINQSGESCKITLENIKPNTDKISDVYCK